VTKWILMTFVVVATGLILAASGAARPAPGVSTTVTSVYTVSGLTVPGADTGLALTAGMSVTVTAEGAICVSGTSRCHGPDGMSEVDTTKSNYGGFVLPGAPAYGLLGRVGDGSWVQVGSGPTTLSGTGDLVFAVNDDLLSDNTGSFTVTVTVVGSSACFPGWGYGDAKHSHVGPPGLLDTCHPGNGYGDANHVHAGPPGHASPSGPTTEDGKKPGSSGGDAHTSGGPGKSRSHGK
jgi:hypothetical protein